jgi:aldose sugar dehydrogenase
MRSNLWHRLFRWTLGALLGLGTASAFALKAVTVAHGLVNPWGLAFLPDGRMLVTERPGRMRVVGADGRVGPALAGLPPVAAVGQGGLLDVVLHPKFADNRWVYWSYAEAGDGGTNGTAVARGRLEGAPGVERLAEVQVIFRQQPKVDSRAHFGSRLVFAQDGRLFVTLGDRFSRKDDAPGTTTHIGKIVRLEDDGRVPADNPFVNTPGAKSELWSLGHRNVQGAALHPATGELWATEHGPQGGDELNRVERGKHYGWPLATFGRNYVTGTRIGEETLAGTEPPVKVWAPTSIGPSGLAFLTSERYPDWKGSLFLGALRGEVLVRLELDGHKVLREQRLLPGLNERIRDVRQGPDGYLYLLTDNADGRVLRLLP